MNEVHRDRQSPYGRQVMALVTQPVRRCATDGRDKILPDGIARIVDVDGSMKIERDESAKESYRHPVIHRLHRIASSEPPAVEALVRMYDISRGKQIQRFILLASLGIVGCGETPPTGQVVAVVNGEEITTAELRTEAEARGVTNAAVRSARAEVLRAVVDRKLLAQAAKREKLDQEVQFVLARRRAEEGYLADLLKQGAISAVEQPSDSDVAQFLNAHPRAFAERTIFEISQVDLSSAVEPFVRNKLSKAPSLDEVERILSDARVVGQRSRTQWNSNFIPIELKSKLDRLKRGKLFLYESADKIIIGDVLLKRSVHQSEREREILIRQSLTKQKVNAAVVSQVGKLRAAATIRLQPGYALAAPDRQ